MNYLLFIPRFLLIVALSFVGPITSLLFIPWLIFRENGEPLNFGHWFILSITGLLTWVFFRVVFGDTLKPTAAIQERFQDRIKNKKIKINEHLTEPTAIASLTVVEVTPRGGSNFKRNAFVALLILVILFFAFLYASSISHQNASLGCKVNNPSINERYTGDCSAGLANGRGRAEGLDVYIGELLNGEPHGKGVYAWKGGDVFTGEWKSGWFINGKYEYQNGNIYEGEFHNNARHGYGVMRSSEKIMDNVSNEISGGGFWASGKFEFACSSRANCMQRIDDVQEKVLDGNKSNKYFLHSNEIIRDYFVAIKCLAVNPDMAPSDCLETASGPFRFALSIAQKKVKYVDVDEIKSGMHKVGDKLFISGRAVLVGSGLTLFKSEFDISPVLGDIDGLSSSKKLFLHKTCSISLDPCTLFIEAEVKKISPFVILAIKDILTAEQFAMIPEFRLSKHLSKIKTDKDVVLFLQKSEAKFH